MNYENFMLLASGLDVLPLVLSYKRQPQLWREDTYLRDYPQGPFKQVESVILRFQERTVHETEEAVKQHLASVDIHECFDLLPYKTLHQARPLVRIAMNIAEGERLGRVMINKIKQGGRIFPHADNELYASYWDRFHICLETTDNVEFRCGREYVHMNPGELWWFRNLVEHEVVNHGGGDRVHMVIDVKTPRGALANPTVDKREVK